MDVIDAVPATDPLEYVRGQLAGLSTRQIMQIALDVGMTPQTVKTVQTGGRDPMYSTVKRLHTMLKEKPIKQNVAHG